MLSLADSGLSGMTVQGAGKPTVIVDLLKTPYGVEVLKDIQVCTISLLQSTVLWIGGVTPAVLPSPFMEF